MTEAEYLTSEDPAAMLSWAKSPNVDPANKAAQCEANRRLSDRKLRLWVEACRHAAGGSDYFDIYNAGLRLAVEYWCGEDGRPLSRADRAALLRDIAGNPHRPVTLPQGPKCQVCRGDGAGWTGDNISSPVDWWECDVCGGAGRLPCPWLTPTVVSLAQAAYDERVAPCGRCGGSGTLLDIEDFDTDARTEESCDRCHGTGIIDDGTLDPVRLAILADALEEAGCGGDVVAHLRRPANCNACDSTGIGMDEYSGTVEVPGHCPRCGGQVGPHYRGCWALSLILGQD